MLMPNILQGFGLEIILIAEIGYLWFQSLKNRKTSTLSAFFKLCSALMLFLLINIPVRMSDLTLVQWKPGFVFVINGLFIWLETYTIYEWFIYFLTVQDENLQQHPGIQRLIRVPLYLIAILLIASYKTHWLFYVDDNGVYTRGTLFVLQLVMPYMYLVASFISAVISYKRTHNRRILSIFLIALSISTVACVLQVIFSGSFNHAGLSLAVVLIYIEMYQYEIKQIENMKSLAVINEQLENANLKLNETVEELKISVENERKANNAKNDFLSRMSHDIRTPLNGIMGIIEIDDRHPDDVKLLAQNRQKAKVAAEHLLSLINDILDMSKLTSGKYEFSREPFVMSKLVSEVCTIAHTTAVNKGITLINVNENDPASPATYGSPLHISRVLLNIIGNAIKYNKPDGSVTVSFVYDQPDHDHISYTISVVDTGVGMNPEYMKKLFEPFSQERVDARSVYDGSGLGMAITKALIEKMDGTIDVQSKLGEGSSFTICLTFEIATDVQKNVQAEAADQNLEDIRILLAEDNELNVDIATTLLEECGANIDIAENGKIAVEKFTSQPEHTYDVILMDCMMPEMNGYEATQVIRNLGREDAKKIPIIAMTANAFADDIRRCLDAGMNDHLPKPFDIAKVICTVQKYVKEK